MVLCVFVSGNGTATVLEMVDVAVPARVEDVVIATRSNTLANGKNFLDTNLNGVIISQQQYEDKYIEYCFNEWVNTS